MSGFFKGMFSGTNEELTTGLVSDSEAVHSRGDEESLEALQADVQGTIDTQVERPIAAESVAERSTNDHLRKDDLVCTLPDPSDFSAVEVWQSGGVSDDEQEFVTKAQDLLGSLPEGTPESVKRQIVEASLKAFEVSIWDIVSGANREADVLRDFIEGINSDAALFAEASESRISELEAEIAEIRLKMRNAEDRRERLVTSANDVIEEVRPVLGFFSPEDAEGLSTTSSRDSLAESATADSMGSDSLPVESHEETLTSAVTDD